MTYKQWDDRWRPHVTHCCALRGVAEFADAILQSSYHLCSECQNYLFVHMAHVLPHDCEDERLIFTLSEQELAEQHPYLIFCREDYLNA